MAVREKKKHRRVKNRSVKSCMTHVEIGILTQVV